MVNLYREIRGEEHDIQVSRPRAIPGLQDTLSLRIYTVPAASRKTLIAMTPRVARRNETKRLDAMLAQSLARFRRTLSHLTDDELTALGRRLALREVRHRWELSGHGLERHRAPLALALLARRRTELDHEREMRTASASRQLRLVETDTGFRTLETPAATEQAA